MLEKAEYRVYSPILDHADKIYYSCLNFFYFLIVFNFWQFACVRFVWSDDSLELCISPHQLAVIY